jgi:DNA-binding CsgD family transcriptional regulator
LFTMTTNATDEHWHRWRLSHLSDFHLLSHYFHDRAMRLAELRSETVLRPLSPRERQCLESVTQGRAPGQVADALGLSLSAVHAYLRAARQKLECNTIEQGHRQGDPARVHSIGGKFWCGRWDSNPHDVAIEGF